MKKIAFFIWITLFPVMAVFCQKISGRLSFNQGQTIGITTKVKTSIAQEAMGQAIDFTVEGTAKHSYRVTNATDDNNTLHHEVNQIAFTFDGMGQKLNFDSENKKDMEGPLGASMKEVTGKTFDIIIDPAGKTLLVKPEQTEIVKADDRMAIVTGMLRDITSIAYPPRKNEASFFKILPDEDVSLNESWTEATEDETGKSNTVYTLSAMTDSTIIIDFKGNSVTISKTEMMGREVITNMNNAFTGKIVLDRKTGIILEKTIATESNGTTEAMGGTLPVTSKTNVTIQVTPGQM
jgi:hypothetical protein